MTTYNVSNSAQLVAALKKATGGDTILLSAGSYGDVALRRLSFDSAVTIKSADPANPAVFRSVALSEVHGLTFDKIRVDFEPTAKTVAWSAAFGIANSSNIAILNSTLEGGPAVNGVPASTAPGGLDATGNVLGLPAARGISVTASKGITLENNEISQFHKGVVLTDVSGMVIRGNEIHHVRTVPINGGNVSNIVVEGNYLHDSNPWQFGGRGDHGDFIHFWTVPGKQAGASTGIDIRNNFLAQGEGTAILGIYLDDNNNGLGFTNVNISGNTIHNGNHQGLRLENVRDGTVTGNVLLQSSGTAKQGPTLVLVGDSSNLKVTNNIFSGPAQASLQADVNGNYFVQRHDAAAGNYSGALFADALQAKSIADLQSRMDAPAAFEGVARLGSLPLVAADPVPAEIRLAGDDVLTGRDGNDNLAGYGGDDVLIGGAGDDRLDGGDGSDTADYSANSGNFTIDLNLRTAQNTGATGADTLVSIENLIGGRGANKFYGNDADNRLVGGAGADLLYAGGGNDILIGGAHKDVMKGGSGSDRFVFELVSDSAVGANRDVIYDFESGLDLLDLSAIDANSATAANEAFTFVGSANFSGKAGELRYYVGTGGTIVAGDVNGDGIADFEILLAYKVVPALADFIL